MHVAPCAVILVGDGTFLRGEYWQVHNETIWQQIRRNVPVHEISLC
jgi:hypothetical protein